MNRKSTYQLKNIIIGLTLVGIMSFMFLAGTLTGFMARPVLADDRPSQFEVFWEVWGLVDQYFVDREEIDPVRMTCLLYTSRCV